MLLFFDVFVTSRLRLVVVFEALFFFFLDPMCLFMYLFCDPGELLLLSRMLNCELVN